MEPITSVLHSAEVSPRVQCALSRSPPKGKSAAPLMSRHHSHFGGTEGKTVTNFTLVCFKCEIHPCDLPFLTSAHSTTNF